MKSEEEIKKKYLRAREDFATYEGTCAETYEHLNGYMLALRWVLKNED